MKNSFFAGSHAGPIVESFRLFGTKKKAIRKMINGHWSGKTISKGKTLDIPNGLKFPGEKAIGTIT